MAGEEGISVEQLLRLWGCMQGAPGRERTAACVCELRTTSASLGAVSGQEDCQLTRVLAEPCPQRTDLEGPGRQQGLGPWRETWRTARPAGLTHGPVPPRCRWTPAGPAPDSRFPRSRGRWKLPDLSRSAHQCWQPAAAHRQQGVPGQPSRRLALLMARRGLGGWPLT